VATTTGKSYGRESKESQKSEILCLRNAGGMYKDLEVVVTTAIGCQIPHTDTGVKDEHGMRVVKVSKNEITHAFHPLHSFPTRIDL